MRVVPVGITLVLLTLSSAFCTSAEPPKLADELKWARHVADDFFEVVGESPANAGASQPGTGAVDQFGPTPIRFWTRSDGGSTRTGRSIPKRYRPTGPRSSIAG
jgi:hypothetical protein